MSRKKRQKWGVGSVFVVPLKDGEYCVGQVIVRERELLNSAAVAFYDRKGQLDADGQLPQVSVESIISVIYVTVDLLNSGRWSVVGQADDSASLPMQPYEHLRDAGFVGAKIRGSSIAESFLNAFYALEAWDDWYVADYLDDFLISPAKKPVDRLVYSGRHPTG
ncbi:Imm26 family immunity protein [Stenotrophomonas sp.]|uniref:Imm26 family immunity protein n=1 Tax=Stenotrophomonas sp. TaxID=69392 RepID=UPI002899B11B|nr:Imm26 family immunity protein [Stenotrophomonas sp.]